MHPLFHGNENNEIGNIVILALVLDMTFKWRKYKHHSMKFACANIAVNTNLFNMESISIDGNNNKNILNDYHSYFSQNDYRRLLIFFVWCLCLMLIFFRSFQLTNLHSVKVTRKKMRDNNFRVHLLKWKWKIGNRTVVFQYPNKYHKCFVCFEVQQKEWQ